MHGKLGILGFGVVGKSLLKYFQNNVNGVEIDVWDQKKLDSELEQNLTSQSIKCFDANAQNIDQFIDSHDYIFPSPGVNLNDFYAHKNKFICELDIFAENFKKPTIAITGSLGKTTTTKLLGQLTAQISKKQGQEWIFGDKAQIKPFVGGNVGIGMLDSIEHRESFDLGVLEISSFQLEFSKYFAPHIAIFTNCFPNHLDRHKTMQNYLKAKLNLLKYQSDQQFAILSEQILSEEALGVLRDELNAVRSQKCFTFINKPNFDWLKSLGLNIDKIFYKNNGNIICYNFKNGHEQVIFDTQVLPDVTFIENWIQVITALYLLNADLKVLAEIFKQNGLEFSIDDHHHRVEYFATVEGVDFYDDSKATVIQSTLAAAKKLSAKGPVILILGGLGKGVDRSPLCGFLSQISNLKKVYCFGPECADFSSIACKFNSLEEIVADIKQIMRSGDQVVLSPSGTSFDFYKNYKERGQVFKDLVTRHS